MRTTKRSLAGSRSLAGTFATCLAAAAMQIAVPAAHALADNPGSGATAETPRGAITTASRGGYPPSDCQDAASHSWPRAAPLGAHTHAPARPALFDPVPASPTALARRAGPPPTGLAAAYAREAGKGIPLSEAKVALETLSRRDADAAIVAEVDAMLRARGDAHAQARRR